MQSHQRLSELVLKYGAYSDKDKPVILKNGDLGIYFVNGEKTGITDTSFLKPKIGKPEPFDIIGHCVNLMKTNPDFDEVIDIMAGKVQELLDDYDGVVAVSGGETRDWVFSGPIAHKLAVPHIVLFKDGRVQYTTASSEDSNGNYKPGTIVETNNPLSASAVHVAGMLTKGSSAYDPNHTPPTGWIPRLREKGITVDHYVTLLTRLQGGEEILAEAMHNGEPAPIQTHSFVVIDEDFLRAYSKDPENAIKSKDSAAWTKEYLKEGDLKSLVAFFDPKGKIDHGTNFIQKYRGHLEQVGRFDELNGMVQTAYGAPIEQLVGGK